MRLGHSVPFSASRHASLGLASLKDARSCEVLSSLNYARTGLCWGVCLLSITREKARYHVRDQRWMHTAWP
ncbi:hypothetical protein OBBRIDRAFT_116759 [Obba rivulosa]|uniref:Uncharacterized protein n=1 Tax=Obba rivulosa TaxID=1052685 RepID=A0A8E2API2_9APHY|nr:hypothetical protein OBBRIDRAFT_116759 [Obba rivulosa]